MSWEEYEETQLGPQREAEQTAERARQLEELEDRQRRGE